MKCHMWHWRSLPLYSIDVPIDHLMRMSHQHREPDHTQWDISSSNPNWRPLGWVFAFFNVLLRCLIVMPSVLCSAMFASVPMSPMFAIVTDNASLDQLLQLPMPMPTDHPTRHGLEGLCLRDGRSCRSFNRPWRRLGAGEVRLDPFFPVEKNKIETPGLR